MIEFTMAMERDFLSRKNVQKLTSAGIDMSDAKYFLFKRVGREYLGTRNECTFGNNAIPTYAISEMIYKIGTINLNSSENLVEQIIKAFIQWSKR